MRLRDLLPAAPEGELRRAIVRRAGLLPPATLVAGAAWPGSPPPAVGLAVLVALLAVLGAAGWRLAGFVLPGRPAATRTTAAVVFATVLATLPATLLGHAGLLFPGPFLLWGAALGLLSRLLPEPRPVGASRDAAPPEAPTEAHRDHRAGLPRRSRAARLRTLERAFAVTTLVVLVATALVQLRTSRYRPPGAFGYDDLSYHLSAVATWAGRGDLAMIRFSYGDPSTPFYPVVGELVSWVLLAPFGDLDVAARWSQLPFALATLVVMVSLGGRLGMRPRSVAPALALYWSLERVFPILALGAGNDHATAFFALASADALVELARRRSAGTGLYAGTALGLLAGTKYLGVLYLPVLGALYLVALASERVRERGSRWLVPELAAACAAVLAGGYSYLRNAVSVGNPFFPAPLTLAGREILPGWEQATLAFRRSLPEFAVDLPEFLVRGDLWGPAAPWLLLPAAVLAPLAALVAPLGERARAGGTPPAGRGVQPALLLLPAALFAVFLFLVHDHRDVRYFLAGIAVAALGWGFLADRLERAGTGGGPGAGAAAILRSAAYAAAVLGAALPRDYGRSVPWAWLLVGVGIGAWAALRWPEVRRRALGLWRSSRHRGRLATAGLLVAFLLGAHVAARYPERKLEHRPVARFLEERGGPAGATVAYAGLNQPYLLWGSRLQNRIVVVPTTGELGARLYRWGGSAVRPFRGRRRFADWIENLDRLGVDYVVVVRTGGENPERRWMLRHPERFTRVFEHEDTEVWAVRPPRARVPGRPRGQLRESDQLEPVESVGVRPS